MHLWTQNNIGKIKLGIQLKEIAIQGVLSIALNIQLSNKRSDQCKYDFKKNIVESQGGIGIRETLNLLTCADSAIKKK